MSNPLITIYITNHNYGQYIEEAVSSVLNQTIQDFEIIIIDDGSTDNSKEIIEGYALHEKIKIIFQQNKGLNVTNNIAMRTASGKYIMRLDADDYLDENALLVMSNLLEQDETLGLVFPDYYMIDAQGTILSLEKRHQFDTDVTLMDQPAHGACTMIRREFLMQLNGYDERYECQDGYELWIKFTNHFKVNNVTTPLFYYRQHGKNLTSNEQKILNTRAKIKADHLKKKREDPMRVVSIIPIRGRKNSKQNLAFEKIGDNHMLDNTISQSLAAQNISKIVISSPDESIGTYIRETYGDQEKVIFIERDKELARLNTSLLATIHQVLAHEVIQNIKPDAVMVQSLEFPFITPHIIDDAVNTMEIFEADSLISVRSETSLFYQHHGHGMVPILNQDKFTRLEREALYRYTGGLSISKVKYFTKSQKFLGGRLGHIVVDQKASHGIFTKYDLDIANFLASHT